MNKLKIAVRGGHNNSVQGAVGILSEVVEDRLYAQAVIKYLRELGHEVLDVTPEYTNTSAQDLTYGVSKANDFGADLFISCHVNAGGGKGTEVLYYGNSVEGKKLAEDVNKSIVALGFKDRTAKADVRGLYELKYTNMVAIIIEPFFLDSQTDVDLYKSVGYDALGKAIAEGIAGVKVPTVEPVKAPVKTATKPKAVKAVNFVLSLQKECNAQGLKDVNGNKLVEDGIFGANTLSALPMLKVGAEGNITKLVQGKIGTTADGIFGNGTKAYVVAFQKANNLTADGVIGKESWKVLCK